MRGPVDKAPPNSFFSPLQRAFDPLRGLVEGLPSSAERVLLRHYRIDEHHSNAYTLWRSMSSPQEPAAEQYARLQAAGQLELLTSPEWLGVKDGSLRIDFPLPRAGVSLLQLSW